MEAEVQLAAFSDSGRWNRAALLMEMFQDILVRVPLMVTQGELSQRSARAIDKLSDHFDRMEAEHPESFWSELNVKEHPEWERVRTIACEVRGILESENLGSGGYPGRVDWMRFG